MDVTPRKRTKIVTLHEHTSSTYREIAKIVGVSLATVSRVIKLKHDTGSVTPKQLEKRFPDGSGIFQQDLAPCHTSKIVKNFMTEKNIQVLDWPGNSPDVSPIENLWAICKSRLRTMDCTTKEMLIQALIQLILLANRTALHTRH
ncbi:uncharacterized protein LOC135097165 [Scylla paramamosain]|uniref:uncharacterized protein LOC135097165 n=1 Tax=Scylla paramamosain TaxID=85552 RepID=UPI0030826EC3